MEVVKSTQREHYLELLRALEQICHIIKNGTSKNVTTSVREEISRTIEKHPEIEPLKSLFESNRFLEALEKGDKALMREFLREKYNVGKASNFPGFILYDTFVALDSEVLAVESIVASESVVAANDVAVVAVAIAHGSIS
jgi:hypothetical protein